MSSAAQRQLSARPWDHGQVFDAAMTSMTASLPDTARHAIAAALTRPIGDFLALPGKDFRSRLVEAAWDLSGSTTPMPRGLASVVELIHSGSLIVDDIQDGSLTRRNRPALHHTLGTPLAINNGTALYFVALNSLATLGLKPTRQLQALRVLVRAMAQCHLGQALDLSLRVDKLPESDVGVLGKTITLHKTGSLTRASMLLGAIAAGANYSARRALGRFGVRLGVSLQRLDDLGNLRGQRDPTRKFEDLKNARVTWPWVYLARHAEPRRFRDLITHQRAVASGSDPALLAATMLQELGDKAWQLPKDSLFQALGTLSADLGGGQAMEQLDMQVRELVVSYG